MISSVGETQEFRDQRWNNATDSQRERYNKEMKEWAYLYPFTAKVMLGPTPCGLSDKEVMDLVDLGEKRRNATK